MRCLVTGASGQLGAALVNFLVNEGATVTAMVRPQSDLWRLRGVLNTVAIIRADLKDLSQAVDAFHAAQPEIVFHLAWQGVASAYRNDPAQIVVNVNGSLDLFQLVHAAGCRTWIGIGSQAEYGPYPRPLVESLPTRPVTAYGLAKLCTGLMIGKLCEMTGIRFVWLRLLAIYGPADDPRHLIPAVIRQLLAGQRPALTPGEQRWDYLYIDDAVRAIYQVAAKNAVQGVYNLGSGRSYTIRHIVERIRDMIDPSLPLSFGDVPYRTDQPMVLEANIEKLKNATGWNPKVDLNEGLRHTVEWYRNERASC